MEVRMALIEQFDRMNKDTNRVHEPVTCGYTKFEAGGRTYLQLDTYGSSNRQIPGKVSQSIQLDEAGAAALLDVLRRTFPRLP
jgi:hypothetical protein